MAFEASNEMFINMKKSEIPKWNKGLSYYEQEIETILFWEHELDKMTNGVLIDGYFVHPWMYYHLNFFKAPIPTADGDKIMNPPLDDNFLYTIETYQEAEEKKRGVCMFGCRGFTKTTLLASLSMWSCTKAPNGYAEINGGSAQDLKHITELCRTAIENTVSPLRLPTKINDWKKEGADFSLTEKGTNDRYNYSSIRVKNAEGGGDTKSEKGAGGNASAWILDEIGKFDPRGLLDSALPAFINQYGMRMVPFLTGTGGNNELSYGARQVLENPESYKMLPMNWGRMERFADLDYIDWKMDKKAKFCTFVPGQMSRRLFSKKKVVPLTDLVDAKGEKLSKIKIEVTDWKEASKEINDQNEAAETETKRNKNRMYYPQHIADCFLTDSINPFPVEKAMEKLVKIRQDPQYKKVEIMHNSDESGFTLKLSEKELAEREYKGTPIDAPYLLYGDAIEDQVPKNFFVGALDDYKTDQSTTTSLGAFYLLKRRAVELNCPIETIKMSLATRPQVQKSFHESIEKGASYLNALINIESADTGFVSFLRNTDRETESYLCSSLNPAQDLLTKKKKRVQSKSLFGTYPTTENKRFRINTVVNYCWQQIKVGDDENGRPIIKYGVEFIEDPYLLEEIIDYESGGNFDRLDAFGWALVYSRELDKNRVVPEDIKRDMDEYDMMNRQTRPKAPRKFKNTSTRRFKNYQ